jgi:ABC-type bacteriocin/lantibiotic exporter with double-glycine peptidase domain
MIKRLTISLSICGLISYKSKFKSYCDFKPKTRLAIAPIAFDYNRKRVGRSRSVLEKTAELMESSDYLLLSSILVITFSSAAISIYTPAIIGNLVTAVQASITTGNSISLHAPALKLLSLFTANGILTWIDIALVTRLGESIAFKLKENLFNSLLHKEMSFFDQRMNGEIIARLNSDVNEFKHTFKIVLTQGLKATAQIVGSVYALINLSSSLSFTLLSTLPPLYLFMNYYGNLDSNSRFISPYPVS